MDTLILAAASRILVGKKAQQLRRRQRIPGVVYGHGLTNQNVEVDRGAFQKIWRRAGSSSLVNLSVDEQPAVKVLIQSIQRHPTTADVDHVDFYRVRMSEKLQTEIELNFIGESPAVKEQGGILVRTMDKVKVECLPGDLVHVIDVDLSGLKTFDDRIHVSDLAVPTGITLLEKSDEVVASITPPRSEAELEALSGAVEEDVTAVSGVERETKEPEAEAPAEGEASPPPSETPS